MLQEEYQKLKKQHAEDNGECSSEESDIWYYVILVSNLLPLVDATKKPFDAKVKENDDFVQKMKKEIDQAERRAKEKKLLEKQVQELLEAKKKDDVALAKLQSNLEKVSDLQAKEKELYEFELEKSRQMLEDAENCCTGRFDVFSKKLTGRFNCRHMTFTRFSDYVCADWSLSLQCMQLILMLRRPEWMSLVKS